MENVTGGSPASVNAPTLTDDACIFCRKFGSKSSTQKQWYDRELRAEEPFVVTAGLGPLAEGYLLILSRNHYSAASNLSATQIVKLRRLKAEVRQVVTERFGHPIIFEHGPAGNGGGGGSCIDHMHLHVQAIDIDIFATINERNRFREVHELHELLQLRGEAYLFIEDQAGRMHVREAHDLRGQYIRRVMCKAIGSPEAWDYATFPNYALIGATLAKLTPWPKVMPF